MEKYHQQNFRPKNLKYLFWCKTYPKHSSLFSVMSEHKNLDLVGFVKQKLAIFFKISINSFFSPFELMESFWNLFKTILLIQEMNLKKNPVEKKIIFRDEKYFEKRCPKKKIWKIFTFLKKIENVWLFEGNFWFSSKSQQFSDFFRTFFSKCFFVAKNYFFSMGFFLSSSPGWGESFWRCFRTIPSVQKVRKMS